MYFNKLMTGLFLAWLLAGCAAPTATPEPTLVPTPSDPSALATQAAVEALAYNLNIPEDSIEVASLEAVDWPDSCLGAGNGSMACAQVVTQGDTISRTNAENSYEYQTNLDGSSVMLSSSY